MDSSRGQVIEREGVDHRAGFSDYVHGRRFDRRG
jgi:hypothetical protein